MKVLIVGGVKFLGEALVRFALEQHMEVVVLSLDKPKHKDVIWIKADRHNTEELRKAFAEHQYFDAIIDNIAFGYDDVKTLAQALDGKFTRYVLTSSVDTYQHNRPVLCHEVDSRLSPTSVEDPKLEFTKYACGKRAAEQALRDLRGTEIVIIRPGVLFGRNDRVNVSSDQAYGRSLYYPLRLLDGAPILLFHQDTRVYQVTWVDDAARAILAASVVPGIHGLDFNVVSPDVMTTEGFIKELCKAAKIPNLPQIVRVGEKYLTEQGLDHKPTYHVSRINPWSIFSSDRAQSILEWEPTPLEDWGHTLFEGIDPKTIYDRRVLEIRIAKEQLKAIPPKEFSPAPRILFDEYEGWSKVGIGTYRGEPTVECDAAYLEAIKTSVHGGINVIDTAINYRDTRSELVINQAVKQLAAEGVERESLKIVTKGGFIPTRLINFFELQPRERAQHHCIRAPYINISLRRSLYNLETYVDLYLLHNPEAALEYMGREQFYGELIKTFALLEQRVADKVIRGYGIATWRGLCLPVDAKCYIDLERVWECAAIVTSAPHFVGIQVPYNPTDHEAATLTNQRGKSVLELAKQMNLITLTSYSVRANSEMPAKQSLEQVAGHAQVTTALVGMRQPSHVKQALSVLRRVNSSKNAIPDIK